MGRGAWWATVHGVAELDVPEVTEHACITDAVHVIKLYCVTHFFTQAQKYHREAAYDKSPPTTNFLFFFNESVGEEFQLLDVGLYNFLVEIVKFQS